MKKNSKSTFRLPLILVMVLGIIFGLSITVWADTSITSVNVTGIDLPVAGQKPDYIGSLAGDAHCHFGSVQEMNDIDITDNKHYINGIIWVDVKNASYMTPEDTFVAGEKYWFGVYVFPNSGYTFTGLNTCSINNKSSLVSQGFPAYPAVGMQSIELVASAAPIKSVEVSGITMPVAGQKPDFDGQLPAGAPYHFANMKELFFNHYNVDKNVNGIYWYDLSKDDYMFPGETFVAGNKYRVEAVLLPNSQYIFADKVNCKLNNDTNCVTFFKEASFGKHFHFGSAVLTAANAPSVPGSGTTVPVEATVKPGQTYQVKTNKYKVITADINGTGTVAFTGSTKDKTKLTSISIPNTVKIDGKTFTVTAIADKAFKNCKKLQKVTIGTAVTAIGKSSFSGCIVLKTVSGAKNVKTIGAYGFRNCKKLAKITLGTKVTSIGNYCFEGCSVLKAVVVGKNVTTIGKAAFKNCKNLTSIQMKGTKLKKIGANALKGVNAKCRIKVPKSKLKTYKSLFAKKGQAKTVTIVK